MGRAAGLAAVALSACAPTEPGSTSAVEVQRAALTTFSFQDGMNGYVGTRDTTLRSATPSENRGDQDDLRMGVDPTDGTQVGLVRWTVTSVPAGSTVTAASATFALTNSSPLAIEARPPLRDWAELEATWLRATNAVAWSSPGASGMVDVGPVFGQVTCAGNTCTLTIPLALAQSWVDVPAQNRGVLLRQTSTALGDFRVASRDAVLQVDRPILRLDVQLPGDAGVVDGGTDAGTVDAGAADGGAADGGAADAGAAGDAGTTASDGGVPDAGPAADAGARDAGFGPPEQYDVGCGCDGAGGLSLVALLVCVTARRRARAPARSGDAPCPSG